MTEKSNISNFPKKFKVWDIKNQEWFDAESAYLGQNGRLYFWHRFTNEIQPLDDDYIPVFFTGKKDKNGKEIFEGDILGDGDDNNFVKVVEWSNEKAAWFCGGVFLFQTILGFGRGTIAGNKFENPELIKNNNAG